MPVIAPAVRGWWRYSRLAATPSITTALLTVCLWVAAVTNSGHSFPLVLAILESLIVVGYLLYGAVNAERARRYGCW